MKTALVTGASSGIGFEISRILSHLGYELILVARRESRLEELQKLLETPSEIITCDLSKEDECKELYKRVKKKDISVLINNAGFGLCGNFNETDLNRELNMINVNVKAVHILTKLFLRDFIKKDEGYILNVASSAGLMAGGPLMAAYYATKSYVVDLTRAINTELSDMGSSVYIGALCPGPVNTEFNEVAEVKFGMKGIDKKYCAKYALFNMFEKRKMIIVPTAGMKFSACASKLLPDRPLLEITKHIQKKKKY